MPRKRSSTLLAPRRRGERDETGKRGKVINRLVENDLIRRVSYETYRDKVRDVYDGPQGAVLAACSLISLHSPLGDRLLRTRKFDLRGAKQILDVGSGAGQIAKHLLKYADPDARVTCFDISSEMLRRARNRLKIGDPQFLVADLTKLPFADGAFDCVTCGYVLEHVPDAKLGLGELSRVMRSGGRMMLLATEDSFSGAFTSRLWRCRTYNRAEIKRVCSELGLIWHKDLWFSPLHKMIKAGGICVELVKE
jgi:ubiquinone/menaquinone biosynthesis C-methylase UbiE